MENPAEYTDPYAVDDDVDDWSEIHGEEGADAADYPAVQYFPPRIPVGLPHVVRFATESGDLPWKERSIVIMVSRFANNEGVATVAVSTLCRAMRVGSKNTVERALNLAADKDVGILKKDPGKGGNGKARKSNVYTFLGADRNWDPLPQTRPGVPPVVALARATRRIEQQDALINELKAEVARLRNGHAVPQDDFIGHKVTNETTDTPTEIASHSYETGGPAVSQEDSDFIGHKKVTNENQGTESQEYLERRARVEKLVLDHQAHFRRSFRGGIPSAVHFFSMSPESEQDLLLQVDTLKADQETEESSDGPPQEPEQAPSGHGGVEYCPDCSRPYSTRFGAEYCPNCTTSRRRADGIDGH